MWVTDQPTNKPTHQGRCYRRYQKSVVLNPPQSKTIWKVKKKYIGITIVILCLWMFSCLCKVLCLRTISIYFFWQKSQSISFAKKILSAQLPCGIKRPSDFNRQENGRKVDFLRRVSQERLNWRAKIWEKYVELPEQIFWGVWQIHRSCQRWFHRIQIERELWIESFYPTQAQESL